MRREELLAVNPLGIKPDPLVQATGKVITRNDTDYTCFMPDALVSTAASRGKCAGTNFKELAIRLTQIDIDKQTLELCSPIPPMKGTIEGKEILLYPFAGITVERFNLLLQRPMKANELQGFYKVLCLDAMRSHGGAVGQSKSDSRVDLQLGHIDGIVFMVGAKEYGLINRKRVEGRLGNQRLRGKIVTTGDERNSGFRIVRYHGDFDKKLRFRLKFAPVLIKD